MDEGEDRDESLLKPGISYKPSPCYIPTMFSRGEADV